MQLMALNALLLFDAIFIFFLFLVSVSCLLYYLPLVPPSHHRSSSLMMMSADDLEDGSLGDIESALVTSTCARGGQDINPDDPATHIMAPPDKGRKKGGRDSRGQPDPPIETV